MNQDEIIEYKPLFVCQDEAKQLLSDEKYKPILNNLYFGLGLVNITNVFTSSPELLYCGSRKSLDEPSPLAYFKTHVSS